MAGRNYGEINYKINFETNTQSLQNLKQQLQEIQNITTTQYQKMNPNASKNSQEAMKELVAIKKEASQVQAALNKAFNINLGTANLQKFRQELNGLNLNTLYKDFLKLGTTGANAFRNLSAELITTNIQMKQSHKLLDNMATSFKNVVK